MFLNLGVNLFKGLCNPNQTVFLSYFPVKWRPTLKTTLFTYFIPFAVSNFRPQTTMLCIVIGTKHYANSLVEIRILAY